jgi:hypothetical protein
LNLIFGLKLIIDNITAAYERMETTEDAARVTLLLAPFVSSELADQFRTEISRINRDLSLNPNTGLPRVS